MNGILMMYFLGRDKLFWTRAILWKIIKVLGYLIGMVRYFPARKKKFFCPILDTSTCIPSYLLHEYGKRRYGYQKSAILNGTRRCQRNDERVHP